MSDPAHPPQYTERLWPGPLGWSFVPGFAVFVVIALLPVDATAAVVAGTVTLLVGVLVAIISSTRVQVDDEFRVGAAHIPVTALGDGRILDPTGVRRELGPGSDARTFVRIRAWIPGAVLVDVTDPADPTPSWLISSRRPQALLSALRAAQAQAHSVQTI